MNEPDRLDPSQVGDTWEDDFEDEEIVCSCYCGCLVELKFLGAFEGDRCSMCSEACVGGP